MSYPGNTIDTIYIEGAPFERRQLMNKYEEHIYNYRFNTTHSMMPFEYWVRNLFIRREKECVGEGAGAGAGAGAGDGDGDGAKDDSYRIKAITLFTHDGQELATGNCLVAKESE